MDGLFDKAMMVLRKGSIQKDEGPRKTALDCYFTLADYFAQPNQENSGFVYELLSNLF